EHLPILRFSVGTELVGVERLVELTGRRVNSNLAKHSLHAKRSCLIRHYRYYALTDLLVAQQHRQNAREYHGRRVLTLTRPCKLLRERFKRRHLEYFFGRTTLGDMSTKLFASFAQVSGFRRILRRSIERYVSKILPRQRDAKTIA